MSRLSFKPSRFNTLITDDADIDGNNNAKAMKVRVLMVLLPPNAGDDRPALAGTINPMVMCP